MPAPCALYVCTPRTLQVLDAPTLRAACMECLIARHATFARHQDAARALRFLYPKALQVGG